MSWLNENTWVLFATGAVILIGYFFRGFLQEAGKDFFSFVKRKFAPAPVLASTGGDAVEKAQAQGLSAEIQRQQLPEPTPHIPDLTLDQIKEAIDRAPPMQRPNIEASYIGIRIRWLVYFRSARDKGETFHVRLSVQPGRLSRVACEVDAATYPQFRILEEDALLIVSGVIGSWEMGDANLKDASFVFPPKEKA